MPRSKFLPLGLAAFVLSLLSPGLAAEPPPLATMPLPAEYHAAEGRLTISAGFNLRLTGAAAADARLVAAADRILHRWEERTGFVFPHGASAAPAAGLTIDCAAPGDAIPQLGEDESYTLDVTPAQASLRAPTVFGALRGLETWAQLLASDGGGWFVPAVGIRDQPRFPWRGLLIDVCRHWQPIDVIERNLDAMALVKLNVLHLHLTEDQGFRIESKKFPRLHEFGSDGHYFTQDQMREIIAYAAARGIRVVPEFDVPGHATSWVVGYPELASAPGPYAIERHWGVFDPVLDPTNEKTYELLDGFLGEMAALFPDAYLHIGGDENNGKQWNANPAIQAFIKEHDLKDNAGLHAYFNGRVHAILAKYGKKLVGWDEILHPGLSNDSVIHSWRGADGLADAARQGYATILSNGYYIDLCYSTAEHYRNDPLPANMPLTPAQQKLVLGGEATMWAEWVTPETIDSRIWPRTAAIAERLWSPREVADVPDMYRRLAVVSQRLEEIGLRHESYLDPLLRRLVGESATPADLATLRAFADLVEPVKRYRRGGQQPDATQFTPLTGFVDAARPDSAPARAFAAQVNEFLFAAGGRTPAAAEALAARLRAWSSLGGEFGALAARFPRVQGAAPVASSLVAASAVGLEALAALPTPPAAGGAWAGPRFAALTSAAQAHGAVELPVVASLRLLVAAVVAEPQRATLSPTEWRTLVEKLAQPEAPAKKTPAH